MNVNGAIINGRKYSAHTLERMAPDTLEVRAILNTRANQLAQNLGFNAGTKEYYDLVKKYIDPRNIPPMVVEDAIINGQKIAGHSPGTWVHETNKVRVITNNNGDVITVIGK
ncbi:hypothetical protein EDC44_1286 [Cricetibacter osteomyelitidis]|uniref:Uncharacterized protein n=1 Tax=Cricetibacter osteomyelitidis TaxID=1521931 RepID=A0A4V2T132_9PAST|nr:hypothetical protein [Cricetibacter osteomyelitidis]TCP92053.1 hypothetical protein EDC44_1286 [Cricetibacter osteomyelitidis]